MNLMLFMMIILSIGLIMMKHPITMGLILISQTIILSLIVGYMIKSFLFSYILIIIMLSGVLVLFIYMASVASNEKFLFNFKLMFLFMISLMVFPLLKEVSKSWSINDIWFYEQIKLIKLFNTVSCYLTLMMIIFLLFTMIVISNIAKVTEGPLRMKN